MLRAVETVLTPVGIRYPQIAEQVNAGVRDKLSTPRHPQPHRASWGPLFDFAERVQNARKNKRT